MTRVTVAAPRIRLELTLPPQATVAELVAQLARLTKGEGTGWVLARGGEPLDPDATVARAGVREGETLILRPNGRSQDGPAHDDIAHLIAETVKQQRKWQPRWIGLAVAFAAIPATVAIVPDSLPALTGLALAALVLAGSLRRKDPTAAATVALSGLPAAVMAARVVVESLGDMRFAAMCAAAVIYALATMALARNPAATAVGIAAGVGFVTGVLGWLTPIPDSTLALAVVVGVPLIVPLLPASKEAGAGLILVAAAGFAHPFVALAAALALALRSRAQSTFLPAAGIGTLAVVAIVNPVPWRRVPARTLDIAEAILLIGLIPLAVGVWYVDTA